MLDLQEFNLNTPTVDTAAEEQKRVAEDEKEQRRLKSAEAKTLARAERRLLLSAFLGLDDWASSLREAQDKLIGLARTDRLSLVRASRKCYLHVCLWGARQQGARNRSSPKNCPRVGTWRNRAAAAGLTSQTPTRQSPTGRVG